MSTLESRMTIKGQVTIPAEARKRLGLKPGDIVRFEIDGNCVRLRQAPSVVEMLYGALRTELPPLDGATLHELAEQAIADEAMERMGLRVATTTS